MLEAQVQVEEVDGEHHRPHEADPGRDGELQERDQFHHVHHVDEEEQRHEERQVRVALPAKRRAEDLVPHGQDGHLAEALGAPGDQLGLTERRPEEPDHDERGQDREQHRLGEPERADREYRCPDEVLQARGGEAAPAKDVAAASGGRNGTGHRLFSTRGIPLRWLARRLAAALMPVFVSLSSPALAALSCWPRPAGLSCWPRPAGLSCWPRPAGLPYRQITKPSEIASPTSMPIGNSIDTPTARPISQ